MHTNDLLLLIIFTRALFALNLHRPLALLAFDPFAVPLLGLLQNEFSPRAVATAMQLARSLILDTLLVLDFILQHSESAYD